MFYLENEEEWCGSPYNVKVMYDLKGHDEECIFRNSDRKFV